MRSRILVSLLAVCAPAAAQFPAYLIDSDLDRLYSVDLTTGAATLIGSSAGILGTPAGLTWRPDTQTLWTIDLAGGEVGTLDTTTGAFTAVFTANPTAGWQGIDYDMSTGRFYLLNQNFNMYSLDPATGVTTLLGATGAPLMTALETDVGGTLWGIGFSNGLLYQVNKLTGAATPGATTAPLNFQGLSFGAGGQLYGSNTTTDSLYTIDTTTGATVLVGAHGAGVQFGKGFEIAFTGSGTPGRVVRSGVGCINGALTFYEEFAPSTFDLAGAPTNSIKLSLVGSGYSVTVGTNTFVAPASVGLGLTDDSLSAALNLPGGGISFPGGSTTQIRIVSNGHVWLSGTAVGADFTPTVAELLTLGPRLCPMWGDLLPDGATNINNCYYDIVGSKAYCTWLNVPEFGGGTPSNTFQVCIDTANSSIEFTWQACGLTGGGHQMITGFSPGAANRNPGNRDISATLPFSTQNDSVPLGQNSQRPVINTTINLLITDIPAGSIGGVEMLGVALGTPIDLGIIGMPTCFLYQTPAVSLAFATGGSSASIPVAIPNLNSLVGGQLSVQAAVATPGINPLGVISSNLATLTIGDI